MPGEQHRPRSRWVPHLARPTDVLEDLVAWLLLVVGLCAVGAAVLVGHRAYDDVRQRGHGARAVPVRVLLLAAAPGRPQAVPAVWTAPDGTERTVEVVVPEPLPAGSAVTAWVERETGTATTPPSATEAAAVGVGAGLGVVAVAASLLLGAWCAVRWATGRHNAAAWAREWARVEPVWSRRVP
jgi:hypothetical protein